MHQNPNSRVPFLAHLLAAAFEVLRFELPVFVIRLKEMVGVDKESRHLKLQNVSFLPGSRIGSFPIHPLGHVSDCLGRSPGHPYQRHEQYPGTSAAD
jgi:hypothetical protein